MTWTAETALDRAGRQLAELLSEEDVEALRQHFRGKRDAVLAAAHDSAGIALALLGQGEAQRRKTLQGLPEENHRRQLLYFALAWSSRLQALLAALDASNLTPNDPAKWALPSALELGASLASHDWLWPLPDPSPFDKP